MVKHGGPMSIRSGPSNNAMGDDGENREKMNPVEFMNKAVEILTDHVNNIQD